jgi:hypothetical protein
MVASTALLLIRQNSKWYADAMVAAAKRFGKSKAQQNRVPRVADKQRRGKKVLKTRQTSTGVDQKTYLAL